MSRRPAALADDLYHRYVHFTREAMHRIQQSRRERHLCYFNDYLKDRVEAEGATDSLTIRALINPSLTAEELRALTIVGKAIVDLDEAFHPNIPAYVDTELFDILRDEDGDRIPSYRLKAGLSASDTLEKLLTEGMTFIHCTIAVTLVYTLAILEFLREELGEIDGKKYFDTLFGSADNKTPKYRRLLISSLATHSNVFAPLSPSAYFIAPPDYFDSTFTLATADSMKARSRIGDRGLPLGAICGFANHNQYHTIQSGVGTAGGMNTIQVAKNRFCGSDSEDELTEMGILEKLRDMINAPHQALAIFLTAISIPEKKAGLIAYLRRAGLNEDEYIPKKANPTNMGMTNVQYTIANIPGLDYNSVVIPDKAHLAELLSTDAETMAERLDAHIDRDRAEVFKRAHTQARTDKIFTDKFRSYCHRNLIAGKTDYAGINSRLIQTKRSPDASSPANQAEIKKLNAERSRLFQGYIERKSTVKDRSAATDAAAGATFS